MHDLGGGEYAMPNGKGTLELSWLRLVGELVLMRGLDFPMRIG